MTTRHKSVGEMRAFLDVVDYKELCKMLAAFHYQMAKRYSAGGAKAQGHYAKSQEYLLKWKQLDELDDEIEEMLSTPPNCNPMPEDLL